MVPSVWRREAEEVGAAIDELLAGGPLAPPLVFTREARVGCIGPHSPRQTEISNSTPVRGSVIRATRLSTAQLSIIGNLITGLIISRRVGLSGPDPACLELRVCG